MENEEIAEAILHYTISPGEVRKRERACEDGEEKRSERERERARERR